MNVFEIDVSEKEHVFKMCKGHIKLNNKKKKRRKKEKKERN